MHEKDEAWTTDQSSNHFPYWLKNGIQQDTFDVVPKTYLEIIKMMWGKTPKPHVYKWKKQGDDDNNNNNK